MRCFSVSVSAVHSDSTVGVVSFDIAGTLKQKEGDLTSRESSVVLAVNSVGR